MSPNGIAYRLLSSPCYLLLAMLLMIFLSSCSHHVSRDGPPDFYVDETKVPNATPKPEPLAKYGNMKSYVVFGKRYYTMKSSKHYEAVGVASWYGTKFHTHNTSSGERYDMLGMTAAHKTLPLPTYVQVTNLRNQRQIIVKVNDRGPFESNRLIDLSYVAAKKLGMLGHGTTMVKIKAIDPYTFGRQTGYSFASRMQTHRVTPPPQSTPTRFASTKQLGEWQPVVTNSISSTHSSLVYLQVGAFKQKAHAERLQQRLVALLSAPVKIAKPSSKGKLYRVQVGPLKDSMTASRISSRLKALGIAANKLQGTFAE